MHEIAMWPLGWLVTSKSSYTSQVCKVNQPKQIEQQANTQGPTRTSDQSKQQATKKQQH